MEYRSNLHELETISIASVLVGKCDHIATTHVAGEVVNRSSEQEAKVCCSSWLILDRRRKEQHPHLVSVHDRTAHA